MIINKIKLIILLTILNSCVAASSITTPTVLERSKKKPPSWLNQNAGQLHEDNDKLLYVYQKNGVVDIALGLEQAYMESFAAIGVTLSDLILEEILDIAARNDIQTLPKIAISTILMRLIEKESTDFIEVLDIYFEKIAINSVKNDQSIDTYYRISVLVRLDKGNINKILSDLRLELENTGRKDFIHIARKLKDRVNQ